MCQDGQRIQPGVLGSEGLQWGNKEASLGEEQGIDGLPAMPATQSIESVALKCSLMGDVMI